MLRLLALLLARAWGVRVPHGTAAPKIEEVLVDPLGRGSWHSPEYSTWAGTCSSFLAIHSGRLDVDAVLGSLYPAVTAFPG